MEIVESIGTKINPFEDFKDLSVLDEDLELNEIIDDLSELNNS